MGFLTSIFGGGEGNIWTILFALAIVIVLIVAGVWALKLVFKASGSMARGRQRRLSLIDTMAIDSKRHLVLIRRDDVEHLIITGSNSDVVIETGIPVPAPASRSTTGEKSERKTGRIQPTMERATAAAQRLGLSSILRQKNDESMRKEQDEDKEPEESKDDKNEKTEPEVSDKPGPLERLRNLGKTTLERTNPSLRHTGLLRPVSEMEVVNLGASEDKLEPENDDSDKNETDEVDLKAMESIEEGATSENASAKADTLNANKEVSNKSG